MKMENDARSNDQISGSESLPSSSIADHFWHPWYAKFYLILMSTYWMALWGMLMVPFAQLSTYLVNAVVLLMFAFNPITFVAILGYGLLKANVACGEWLIIPRDNHQRPLIDPHTDAFDCRSGDLHLRHIGLIHD